MRPRFIAALAAATMLSSAAQAQEVISFSHWLPSAHTMHPTGMVPWTESIREASNGELVVDIYPAQQLGAAADHYDMARDGIADITHINPGYQPGRFPIAALGEVPFHITNAIEGSRAFDEWYREYAAEEMSDVYFCMALLHDPGSLHSKMPIHLPADVRGRMVRPSHATMGRFVTMLGGTNVQGSAPEARELLARGTADAIAFPWDGLTLFGIDEVVNHHLDIPLYATTFVNVMNRDRYEALSEEHRGIIDDHCTSEEAEKMARGWAEVEMAGRERLRDDPARTTYTPTDDEVELWREAAAPLLDAWKQDVAARGADPEAIYARFREVMARHNSLME